MVRETRHLWVGNLPDNIREDRIREHFKRYGRVQSVKLLPRGAKEEAGESAMACTVAFMDIKSASKAHNAEHKIDDRTLTTEYYEPAAIPSAASPQNTPSSYSTSPGSTRFPNGHGSTEEHANFGDRFYERPNNRVTEGEFIRRTNYHDNCRGRNRERSYRNGPYNAIMDRSHRTLNNSWTAYDSTRYNSQNETGYVSTPSDSNERRSSDQSTKKRAKSRSGSRSPSPSGSTSSRSPSRSRSRSSSSSSSSSTSRDTSSSSEKRPVAIRVKNLPPRSSDTSLKDGLFHEYKKHGKVTWVKVVGQGADRYAIVCFKKPEDVEKALEVSYDKLFFGCKIEVEPYQGYDVEDNDLRPYEAEIDEFHPKATRTLFIGNLEKDVTASDLRKHFDLFGEIIEIDIKKQGAVGSYAFCQYSDIVSVVKAIRAMDGEHLGNNRIKLGFGKSMPTNCVWVDGVVEVNEKYLRIHFEPFGSISKVHVDRDKGQALIFYEQVVGAQLAVNKMRGFSVKGSKIQVDFASRECQESFFEHLEKQGTVLDRTGFEERRDSVTRTFDATTTTTTTTNRFSRYDTPTRPRTSSYSSRSSATASQVTSAIPSPGTPGSVTPRGSGSRTRVARFAEYYDQTGEYAADRHFRNYDEYSQGSAASHEEGYEQEYPYTSPSHVEAADARTVPAVVNDHSTTAFVQPDIRNLQKERVHLLEQLEECPSSGDELISPKKRLKLDLIENSVASDVIIEANRDHRKVMEVRRLSDPNIKHHSRRPSVDNKHVTHDRSSYLPHAICKRRKTAGSDSGSRTHHYDHSGSESVGGSRPGTPLVDERPEHFTPSEPRRVPREREGPLTLPLPRFAAQVMNRGSVSVAGIKGQKENILSSPPPAVTSPRISNPKPPSPVHVPPPASPPPRPPSLSSNSSDSDITPPSPSLDERIRSLVEKYEKWSGSRALSAAGGEALAKSDATREKFRLRHKLLDLDLKEVQPSEIVKSVMAKRSVFDEDLKRLENVGEKYEPKEFSSFQRVTSNVQISIPPLPSSAPPIPTATQLPKTPTMLSPRSAGANVTAAKGLQYPFPSHPPIQLTPPVLHPQAPPGTPTTPTPSTSSSTTPLPPVSTTSTITRGTNHGDNRLKPCTSVSSDNRTSSKVNVNRSGVVSSLAPSLAPLKTSDKNSVNIPNSSDVSATTQSPIGNLCAATDKLTVKIVKTADKPSDRITCRRDSNSSSPRGDVKVRRNSDASIKRIEDNEKYSDSSGDKQEERLKSDEKKEQQRLEKIRLENERLERERLEKERLEKEKQEKERAEKEKLERERLERESELEKERLEKERLERERIERERRREREERERREKEEKERREREEQERLERERREQEEKQKREEDERLERERQERDRIEKERLERERKREEEKKHKEDNHDKRKEEHRHRENHSESKHRDNNHLHDNKNTKEHESFRKDSHESRSSHEKNRHHIERDAERRKESVKENRDNNVHEKQKTFTNDLRENKIESRHMSIDFDRTKSYDGLVKTDSSKRKERNNSLPANVGVKRRLSAHDSIENIDDVKKIKLSQEHKKISERRDSKDSTRSDEKMKNKHKNNTKLYDDKVKQHNNTKECEEKRKDRDDKHKSKQQKIEKHKLKSKSREKECRESPSTPKSPVKELTDKDFLARLDLRSNEELEKQKQLRKENKEKRKLEEDDKKDKDETKKSDSKRDKHSLEKCKSREENSAPKNDDRKCPKKDRPRKLTQNSSENSDSDEPKKHSIFDIVDDEPAYISMYDKVKARSCKNMQKQEEEKRQEKIKAKFSQLKQSRAKREEKKRSTSWDEDSDSDRERSEKIDHKTRRGNKMLIMSSDEEEPACKSHKKLEIYSDSDSERPRQIKSEHNETSEDERFRSKLQRKGSKSRITSDTSEDEMKKIQDQIKSEIFSDNEVDQGFADAEDKPFNSKVKDEFNRIIKKSREKHQESLVDQMNAQIFGDSSSPVLDMKTERFNNRHSFGENSSAEENIEKKERSEIRKKHKKKQKRQKHSLSSEECNKLETVVDGLLTEPTEKIKHHEKKKQHSKKDKKRDKSRDERERSRKSKKTKSDVKSDFKRDGKMENIFGSLSEDSESCIKESEQSDHKSSLFHERFNESNVKNLIYASDSDREQEKLFKCDDKERESKEEHRKRKEKKRREKERRLQEEASVAENVNDNSMDYVDMGKQLEANIKDDSMEEMIIKNEIDSGQDVGEDLFKFSESSEFHDIKKDERKEAREKKKKRKKSKEEKQKHHHHHHHDKNKIKSEVKKESSVEEPKVETEESKSQSHSLPNLIDATPSPPQNKSSSSLEFAISPIPRETLISPIPKTPTTSKEKKREKFLPGFGGTEIDEKIHENAVKSISEFETPTEVVKKNAEEPKSEPTVESPEEKPRVVISQEETEDAVAALLGESFGSGQFEECYNEEDINTSNEQTSNLADDNVAQDDEEMRQAVQSLSASDLDVKPETPQSEHELQIDTDTEEPEEPPPVRFDQPPKTPEITQSVPTKTTEVPNYYRSEEQKVVVKPTPNIGSPPSLTPIKPQTTIANEIKKPEETKPTPLSLPMLPEQTRTVISQAWNVEKKETPKAESPKITSTQSQTVTQTTQPKSTVAVPLRTYGSPPIKISESTYPPLAALTKQEHPQISSVPEQIKVQTYPVLQQNQKPVHNLPICSPVPQKSMPNDSPISMSAKTATSTTLSFSRLPITPIMVSKPLQATTVLLPQAKIAHSLEPPVLVSSSEPRTQDRPRMVFQTTSNVTSHFSNIVQSPPRMMVQAGVPVNRSLPSQGLLVPTRQLPPTSYSYLNSIPPTSYNLTTAINKDNIVAQSDKVDLPKSTPSTQNCVVKQAIIMSTQSHQSQSNTITTVKPFMPVIKETTPKVISVPEIRVTQPTIIQHAAKPQPLPPQENTSKEIEKPEPDLLKVTPDVPRISTPSPVIVQTPQKEPQKEPPPKELEKKITTPPPISPPLKVEEPPKQLAIEKVTEELNLTLKKEVVEVKEEPEVKEEVKVAVEPPPVEVNAEDEEPKSDTTKQTLSDSSSNSIKETDEEKADTESIVSDISKERSSADILTSKDDPLDNKEDSDYWSAKEVNIDSVIKTLCSADELSDHSSEAGKDEWLDETKVDAEIKSEDSPKKEPLCEEMSEHFDEAVDHDEKEAAFRIVSRRGGRGRGRKTRGGLDRSSIQTRRGKVVKEPVTPSKRGGRGGGKQKGERKNSKSESEITSDVYEFRDDSDESNANKERPRLILTIKSPAVANPQPIVKEVVKEVTKEPSPKPVENKEEFLSPVANTRKSRRLQERDVLRNTVDDTIEDVVRNTVMVTRSSTNQNARRSTRQAVVNKASPETPRKSPRGGRKKDRRASDPSEDSSEEKCKTDTEAKPENENTEVEKPKENHKEEPKSEVKEKPHEGLKVKMLRRVKGDMAQEPTNLIDPVTGLLTPMRECEEGRYIPLPKTVNDNQQKTVIALPQQQASAAVQQTQKQPQQPPQPQLQQQQPPPQQQHKPKPQSLKAHVLSSQAAKTVVQPVLQQTQSQTQPLQQQQQQHQQPQPLQVKKTNIIVNQPVVPVQPPVVPKSTTPLNQALNVNVSMATFSTSHPSPRSSGPITVMSKNLQGAKPPLVSPVPIASLTTPQKPLLQVNKQQTSTIVSKSPMVHPTMTNQIINTQAAHLKQQPQPMKQAVINKVKPPHNMHQQQILAGSVASPPLGKGPIPGLVAGANQNRIVQGSSHQKGAMEPPKIDVALSNVILGPRSNLSPQGQPRHVTQSGMPVPAYEASLGEAIAHFPPGTVPLRPPHDLPPGHYMHPHMMQYQFMRQQPYHLPRSPMVAGGVEKSGDGQEGEEAPVTSPPLELRRPGSVGLALSGRTAVVPHSLHSPHDRTTDSPQVGQVYNVHTARMQHYHTTGRYYEQTAEPPPAHRPLTSHGSLTALANDRSISHLAALGAPERPIGGHMQPDRPLSSHSALTAHMGGLGTPDRPISTHLPERPLSSHGLVMGAGLGAAGNLMGAVARHVGVDAPTSQRGLQAATPPHASQVPPQAESLFMLLKQYPCMWQGLLALKNDQAAVQMYFVSGNDQVAKCSLPKNTDGSTPPLRIFQRMRLEPPQVEGVARKMQMENEHCMLLALPCGHDHMDVLKQSTNLTNGFITYLQQKQAAGIVNVAAPGTTQPPAYVVHIFPSCDFVNENLRRIAPSLLERVADIAHLLIVITTV